MFYVITSINGLKKALTWQQIYKTKLNGIIYNMVLCNSKYYIHSSTSIINFEDPVIIHSLFQTKRDKFYKVSL